jgi:hypothetical protein
MFPRYTITNVIEPPKSFSEAKKFIAALQGSYAQNSQRASCDFQGAIRARRAV